jgi:hypothetical protein
MGYRRNTVPLKGPFAIIFFVGIGLFLGFFFLNFFMAMFNPDFFLTVGTWFFFIPFLIMMVMVFTIFIGSILTMAKGGMAVNAGFFSGSSLQNLTAVAVQQGYQVKTLTAQDPSGAQLLLENDQQKYLIKILTTNQPFNSGMVQDLSKGLSQYQAKEAWIIQTPTTFIENDKNFARFYNVSLLSIEEALAKLNPVQGS